MITVMSVLVVLAAIVGYLSGRSMRCASGVHRGPFNVSYALLNRGRPWCWHITVHCADCKAVVCDHHLDERDAEAFLGKKSGRTDAPGKDS